MQNVKLTDKDNETIKSVVIFNAVCELLFKRTGSDFKSDNEAKAAWNELIINNSYNLTIKRNKVCMFVDRCVNIYSHCICAEKKRISISSINICVHG